MSDQQPYTGNTQPFDPANTPPSTRPFDLPRPQGPAQGAPPTRSPRRADTSRTWLIGGAVLLALGIALLGGGRFPWRGGSVEAALPFSQHFDARNLEVDLGAGNVQVVGGDIEGIDVRIETRGFGATQADAQRAAEEFQPILNQDDDTLEIEMPRTFLGILLGRAPFMDVYVTVPRDAVAHTTTGSGNIDVRDVQGALQLETGSGNIVVDGPTAELIVDTGSGDINITNGQHVRSDLKAGSGNISYAGSFDSSEDQQASTGSGNIVLQLPAGTNLDVEAETGSGDITSDWSMTGDDEERRGTLGTGGSTLELETGSGNITLQQR